MEEQAQSNKGQSTQAGGRPLLPHPLLHTLCHCLAAGQSGCGGRAAQISWLRFFERNGERRARWRIARCCARCCAGAPALPACAARPAAANIQSCVSATTLLPRRQRGSVVQTARSQFSSDGGAPGALLVAGPSPEHTADISGPRLPSSRGGAARRRAMPGAAAGAAVAQRAALGAATWPALARRCPRPADARGGRRQQQQQQHRGRARAS